MDKNIEEYLDSTYLKTSAEAGISEEENKKILFSLVDEAIKYNFACIMIRPKYVAEIFKKIQQKNSSIKLGTVVDFPLGDSSTKEKVNEALTCINNGAHDIDFVCDYNAFKRGNFQKFAADIIEGTKICVQRKRITKWIIETGALSREEIMKITKKIVSLTQDNFSESVKNIFIKTSTGYYNGAGANISDVKLIKSFSKNLKIKASGGIYSYQFAKKLIIAGADRIGTSKAKLIYNKQ